MRPARTDNGWSTFVAVALFLVMAATWAFIDSPSDATAAPLCAAGIDAIWVDPARTSSRDWEPWATPVIVEDDVIVLRFSDSACG